MKTQSPLQIGKECFLNAMGRTLVVEILGLSGDTIWISYPTADIIKEGTGVELTFHEPTGFVGFHARVASGPEMNSSGIMLERAESARHNKERKNWRVPTDFLVIINAYGDKKTRKAQMKDITIDGALIHTPDELLAGEMLELKFQLPKTQSETLLVQIVYSDPTTPDKDNRYGLRFIEVPKKAKENITWFLYEKIQGLYPQKLRDLYPRPKKKRPAKT